MDSQTVFEMRYSFKKGKGKHMLAYFNSANERVIKQISKEMPLDQNKMELLKKHQF